MEKFKKHQLTKSQCLYVFILTTFFVVSANVSLSKIVTIEYTESDSYSLEVASIDVGDTVKWIPKNEGHNVEFFAGPKMNNLPPKSEIDKLHSIVFHDAGVYLYGCTPHADMGMIGLIIVGGDFHNLEKTSNFRMSRVASSVLRRLIKNAKRN